MKKIIILGCVFVFILSMNSIVFAETSRLNASKYKVFQGVNGDYGYVNWPIDSCYCADLITYSTSKTIEKHDVLAHTDVAKDPLIGYGNYYINSIQVYAGTIRVNNYTSFSGINYDYMYYADHTYLYTGVLGGTSMGISTSGIVVVTMTFLYNEFVPVGDWTNSMTCTF